jgi:hypothetical protein
MQDIPAGELVEGYETKKGSNKNVKERRPKKRGPLGPSQDSLFVFHHPVS